MEHDFEVSQLHKHSLGLVTAVNERFSDEISVMLIELRLNNVEEVANATEVSTVNFDTIGGKDTVTVQQGNSVPAKWIKYNSHQVFAPNVRRNDLVEVYRLGNTDQYFWVDRNTANVKRLEDVVYAISADPANPMKEDLSNAYWFSWSSIDKTITLQTSKANGEPFAWNMQFNLGEGIFSIQADTGDEVFINARDTIIGMINADGTEFELNKQNILGYAPDTMKVKADNLINFICKHFKVEASDDVLIQTNSCTTKASTILMQAKSVTSDAPNTTATGNLSVGGNISVGGAGRSGGGGNCTVAGKMTANEIKCSKFNADQGYIDNFKHGGGKCC